MGEVNYFSDRNHWFISKLCLQTACSKSHGCKRKTKTALGKQLRYKMDLSIVGFLRLYQPSIYRSNCCFVFLRMCLPTVELSSHDETNTAEVIDQMFEEVLEYAGRMQGEEVEDEDTEDHDSGIGVCPGDKDKMDMESEKEKSEEEHESNGDELLTFPPSGILSPLSKSVEAVVTPLVRLVHNFELFVHKFNYGAV